MRTRDGRLQLKFNPPLAWERLLAYLKFRAIPGVETVDATHYRRTLGIEALSGWIEVSLAGSGTALEVGLSPSLRPAAGRILSGVTRVFDLAATPDAVRDHLSLDPLLAGIVERLPGLRVPGAFDGFELAVRAVLGQQVSVKAATTMAGRWAAKFGTAIETPHANLGRLTPTATVIASRSLDDIAALGIIGSRARCILAVARAVVEGRVDLSVPAIPTSTANVQAQIESLLQLPGIGAWTAQYIAMRALDWRDAFPGTDLMLLRAAKLPAKDLAARAEGWRPWRAYATHYLWHSLEAAAAVAEAPVAPPSDGSQILEHRSHR